MFSATSNTKTSAFNPVHSSASPPSSSPLQTVAQDLAKKATSKKATTVPVSGFSFPYAAYPIQNDLMRAIYTCIKTRRVGVFESPTGTGKTLSVICSTLTFLREHYQLGEDEDDENDQHDGLTTTTTTMGSNAVSAVAVGVINPHHNKNSRPSTPIDDEPDWCVNFEAERSLSLKQKAFSKAKLFRDALAEKLEKLRLTTDSRSNEGGGGGPSQGAARISKSERRHRYLRMRQETSGIANKLSTRPSILSSSKRERDSDDADLDQESTRSESESGGKVASSRQRRESSTLSGGGGGVESDDEDLHLIPLEYHSDEDEDAKAVSEASSVSATLGIADRIREQVARERASLSATQRGSEKEEEEEEEAAAFRPKIFFVSRTHSQISQFVREIGKTEFGKNVRVVALGSRSTLCVNPEVVDLPTDARVNERCLELQDEARGSSAAAVAAAAAAGERKVGKQQQQHRDHDKKSGGVVPAGKKGCPFIDAASQEVFKDRLLAGLRDVEDAAELGWTSGTCAYYGSRKAIKYAEVVAMPYSMLLHSGTRAAAGIEPHLKGSVVVIDEAHNIIDAINSTHAAMVTYHQLIVAAEAVTEYLTKYKSRMKGSNVAHCAMLAEAFFSLAHFLKPTSTRGETTTPSPNPISLSTTLSSTAPKGSSPNTESFQIPLYSTSSFRPPHPAFSSSSSSSSSFHDISAGNSPPMVPSMSGGQSSQQSSHPPSRSDSPFAVSVSVSTIAAQIAAISSDSPVATSNTAPTTPTVTPAQSASRERTISPLLHGTPMNQQRAAFVTSSSSSSSSLPGSKTATCVRGSDAPTVAMFSPVIAPPLHPSSMTASSSSSHLHRPTPLSGNLLCQTLGSGHMSPKNVDLPTPQPLSLPNSSVHTVSDFLVCSGITMSSSKTSSSSSSSSSSTSSTSTNLFKVRRYVEAVDLLKKLRGFAELGARAAAAAAAKEVIIYTRKHQKGGGGTSTSHTLQRSSHTSSSAITAAATTADGEITMNNGGGGESGKMINSTATSASSYMASVTAIQTAYNFLCCLMGADCDGRIVVNRVGIDFNSSRGGGGSTDVASSSVSSSSQPFFKFVLLNPAVPFLRVVQNARSVVLVGGTMQPISDITDQLFGHLPSNRVITFSCGHVIPRENLAVFTLAKGPTGQAFDFRHASRSSTAMIAELGRAIVNLSSLIPSGLVVFMPSYDYLRTALAIWSKAPTQQQQLHSTSQVGGGGGGGGGGIAQPLLTYQQQMDVQNFKSSSSSIAQTAAQQQQQQQSLPGASLPAAPVGSVLAMLQKKKRVFAEPKSSSDVEAILRAYTLAIRSPSSSSSSSSSSSRPPSRSDTPIRDDGGFSLLDEESDVNHNDHVDYDNARLLMNSSTIPTGGSTGGGGGGALLFCVVGGKMSEGINFSDDLARGVAVVGLPYPNPSDPELVERMAYLDRRGAANVNQQQQRQQQQQQQHSTLFLSSSGSITLNNTSANTSTLPLPSPPPAPHSMTTGREYYENLTIRAVNQAIGRSIRHAKDYAVIVLLDGRYTQQRIKSKLPGWISERISSSSSVGGVDPNGWGPCASGIGTFFRTKAAAGAATSGSSVSSTVLKAV